MKRQIFVSWSGKESRLVAEALRAWLPCVLQNTSPWLSSVDIDAGSRWNDGMSVALRDSIFGILCLSANNLREPWVLFEAGALAKQFPNDRVCPYLFGITVHDLPGPLAQFQGVETSREGTLELLLSLNKALDKNGDGLTEAVLKRTFDMCWPELQAKLHAIETRQPRKPVEIIRTVKHRTESIVEDLSTLKAEIGDKPLKPVVRYSGYLSSFAFNSKVPLTLEGVLDESKLLLEERECLLQLAEAKCDVFCVISPPLANDFEPRVVVERLRARVTELIRFIQEEGDKYPTLHWAIAPFRQKNLYIVGMNAYYEGFRTGAHPGYDFTIRAQDPHTVKTSSELYDTMFQYLATFTATYFPGQHSMGTEPELRQSVLQYLRESKNALDRICERPVPKSTSIANHRRRKSRRHEL